MRVNILDWHFTDGQPDLRKLGPNRPNSLYSGVRGALRVWGEHSGEVRPGCGGGDGGGNTQGMCPGYRGRWWGEHSGELCPGFGGNTQGRFAKALGGTPRELASLPMEAEDFLQKASPGFESPVN